MILPKTGPIELDLVFSMKPEFRSLILIHQVILSLILIASKFTSLLTCTSFLDTVPQSYNVKLVPTAQLVRVQKRAGGPVTAVVDVKLDLVPDHNITVAIYQR